MKRVFLDDKGVVLSVLSDLRSGGVVMHPTETCYGLAVDIFNKNALRRLYELKGMSADKPLSILVSDIEMALDYGCFSKKALDLVDKFWPGPLGILVPRKEKLPKFFNKGHEFVSIRCSSFDFCSGFVREFGFPVTTTSANFSGEKELYSVDSLPEVLVDGVDLLIDAGEIEKNPPSSLVKVVGDDVVVLRAGKLFGGVQ